MINGQCLRLSVRDKFDASETSSMHPRLPKIAQGTSRRLERSTGSVSINTQRADIRVEEHLTPERDLSRW